MTPRRFAVSRESAWRTGPPKWTFTAYGVALATVHLALAGFGTRHEDIATYLGVTRPTLRKHYKEELATGSIKANSAVAKTLYKLAIDGDSRSCMFWLKTRAGWRETDRHEITGAEGAPLIPVIQVVFDDEPDEEEATD